MPFVSLCLRSGQAISLQLFHCTGRVNQFSLALGNGDPLKVKSLEARNSKTADLLCDISKAERSFKVQLCGGS